MISLMSFAKIKELKNKGLKRSQVARILHISRDTVNKYWEMDDEDYMAAKTAAQSRAKKPDEFRDFILEYLRDFPDVSAAQIYDRIREATGLDELGFSERTLRNYVGSLRKKENIPKPKSFRQYQTVEELPPGFQAQVDFGECWLQTTEGKRKKLYCFAMVLSHSRYKYVSWQTRPFTTQTFLQHHMDALQFFGGVPKEIVYDQDRVLAVSENGGDIVYTEGFQGFVKEMGFSVYLCRPADPESKGKIENVVKYVKNNFAKNRTFTDIDSFNEQCLAWLRRTGNGKEHQGIKKVPAEVFTNEKEYLQPVPPSSNYVRSKETLSYPIRKDNVVVWKGNRYRVPFGSYEPGRRVYMVEDNGKVHIMDVQTGAVLMWHHIPSEKGKTVGCRNDPRETSKSLRELEDSVLELFNNSEEINVYMEKLKAVKTRYYRDQLYLLVKLFEDFSFPVIEQALLYCLEKEIYSGNEMRTVAVYCNDRIENGSLESRSSSSVPIPEHLKTRGCSQPDLNAYERVLKG